MSIVEMRVPTIGESVTEVTLSQWLKGNGEFVKLDESICEFESDKATLEFPAEATGKLVWAAEEGDDLEIGALVARIDTSVKAPAGGGDASPAPAKKEAAPETQKTAAPAMATEGSYANGHPSPAAAKLMREQNLSSADVTATGKDGRITQEDVKQAVAKKGKAPAAPAPAAPTAPAPAAPAPPAPRALNRPPAIWTLVRIPSWRSNNTSDRSCSCCPQDRLSLMAQST